MDKNQLLQDVLAHLQADLEQASLAALSAHEAATHEENVAENKYDTLGLEAAYLASGQARRVEELRQTLITWRQLRPRPFDKVQGIELGALILLASEDGHEQWLFLGPQGASMKLQHAGQNIQVLSNAAPLGRLLLGKHSGDEITLPMGQQLRAFEVLTVD
ncbi:transcription elongation factor GreAB [Pseudomonas sp. o96-267]|uniref:GreA/GreB family elongation factor n=1 Tax=Pseudomonas sp. o96-267 TaxID=2479853 RepID=UPI000F7ADE66|nr:GreA/GreB family elongation factor [Pseudomonas sp. o96-267]RRV29149.1 transcription elongation factor GreAB [Pseudomonas sp. o96-267]